MRLSICMCYTLSIITIQPTLAMPTIQIDGLKGTQFYMPLTQTVFTKESTSLLHASGAVAVMYKQRIYFIGGITGKILLNDVISYDPIMQVHATGGGIVRDSNQESLAGGNHPLHPPRCWW
jgi:hypothetical protein